MVNAGLGGNVVMNFKGNPCTWVSLMLYFKRCDYKTRMPIYGWCRQR